MRKKYHYKRIASPEEDKLWDNINSLGQDGWKLFSMPEERYLQGVTVHAALLVQVTKYKV